MSVGVKFLVVFIPTCAIAAGGLQLGVHQSGFWSGVGWITGSVFGFAALWELSILITGLVRLHQWQHSAEQKLEEFEQRDAELFAQGKSFDEVMSQYRNSKP